MTFRAVSGYSGYVPQATGTVISYIRDPKKYKINTWVQLIKSPKPTGLYTRLHRDDSVRVVSDEEYAWEDGADRPTGPTENQRFEQVEFRTYRRDYPFTLGWQAIENTEWPVLVAHSAMAQNKCIINRTNRNLRLLQTVANWPATNTADANTLNGGLGAWDTATSTDGDPTYLAIKKTLNAAVVRINLATNGIAQPSDLRLLISPNTALAISNTSEIHDFIKGSPAAMAQIRGDTPNQNQFYGLPETLYSIPLVVEDTVIVTERAKADGSHAGTTTRLYAKNDDTAILLTRVGGLDGNYGVHSWSTIQNFFFGEEMKVAAFDDSENELTRGHVSEQFKEVLAAPESGFLITDILSYV